MLNLSIIFHMFSLVCFVILLWKLVELQSKLAYQKKVFASLKPNSHKIVGNPLQFIKFLIQHFEIKSKVNVKIEEPSIIQARSWLEALISGSIQAIEWQSPDSLVVYSREHFALEGSLGKKIQVKINVGD